MGLEAQAAREFDLKDSWNVIARRKWVVFCFFVICATTVIIGTFLTIPLYRATAIIVVEGDNPALSAEAPTVLNAGGFQIFENYLETQMALIKSRSVAEPIFDQFNLAFAPPYRNHKDPFKKFLEDIHLSRLRGTRIIQISMDYPEAKLAADIANRLAEAYAQNNLSRRALAFIQSQRMQYLNSEYLRLQSELDRLSARHRPTDPQMVALREEIATIAKRLEEGRRDESGSETLGKISSAQASLDKLLLKIQEDSVLSSSRMNNIFVHDRAKVPTEVFRPRKIANISLGFLMGLLGGIFLAFLFERFDNTVKTDEDVRNRIGSTPFLGSIPLARGVKNHRRRESIVDHLVSLEPESDFAEAYRLIRTGILRLGNKLELSRDIAVLSPAISEGKTTVASNLAIAMAQVGKRTLLVDADFRKGRLQKSYGLPNGEGLGHYLVGEASLEEIIKETEVPNLSLVCCGKSVIDPSQLLNSPQMATFVEEMRRRFEFIIYDTPPLTLISDASILISQLSAAALDVRSGMTTYPLIPKALEMIKASHTQLLGVILDATTYSKGSYYNQYHRSFSSPPARAGK